MPSIALASSIAVVVNGHTVVHSESLNARMTTLPRNECSETGCPNWSASEKSGATPDTGVPGSRSGFVASASACDVPAEFERARMTSVMPSTTSSTVPAVAKRSRPAGSRNLGPGDSRGRDQPRRRKSARTLSATTAIATNASATMPTMSSTPLFWAGWPAALAPPLLSAADDPPEGATDGSLTPPASASFPTAASAALNSPAPPDPIEIPPSARYPDAAEWPGQLNPNPFGITTSRRCLYASDSSIPRKRAYSRGWCHNSVTEPRSNGLAMIATRTGKPSRAAAFSKFPSWTCCWTDRPASDPANRSW